MRLELHPEARGEFRSAALWYDERRPGLGEEFISEVSAALGRIGDAPDSYPAWRGTRAAGPLIRKATLQRFPDVIAFEKHEHHVLVLAVAHQAPATLLAHAGGPLKVNMDQENAPPVPVVNASLLLSAFGYWLSFHE